MSKTNEQPKTGTQLSLFEDEMARVADANVVAERSTGNNSFISLKGGVLAYRGQPIAGNTIDVGVLAAPIERLFYSSRYDPSNPAGPACFALAASAIGMRPSALSSAPQHDSCEKCPKNEWGSSATGGKGKACKETRRLLLITADSTESVEAATAAEVASLRPPVTSLKNFAAYLQTIAASIRRPLAGVVTRISVVPDPKSLYKVNFEFVRKIDATDVVMALMKRSEEEVLKAIESAGASEEHAPEVAASGKF